MEDQVQLEKQQRRLKRGPAWDGGCSIRRVRDGTRAEMPKPGPYEP